MYQQITIIGALGRDPEMRYTPNGKAVTNLSVAANSGYGEHKKTTWFRVSVWGKQAEACNNYLHKGAKVIVTGELQPDDNGNPRTWQDNQGNTRASFEVSASNVKFLETNKEKQSGGGQTNSDRINAATVPF